MHLSHVTWRQSQGFLAWDFPLLVSDFGVFRILDFQIRGIPLV
jgi:hypothetical protein